MKGERGEKEEVVAKQRAVVVRSTGFDIVITIMQRVGMDWKYAFRGCSCTAHSLSLGKGLCIIGTECIIKSLPKTQICVRIMNNRPIRRFRAL